MKMAIASFAAALLTAGLSSAQAPATEQVAAEPLHRTVLTAFVLPELQPELGLSTQQVAQLRQLKQEMQNKGQEYATKIAARRKELGSMLNPGTSKGEHVKRVLEEIALLKADRLYSIYEAEARMQIPLTETQRSKLAAIKPHDLQQAMSRVTADEKMEIMGFMDAARGMVHEADPAHS